MAKKELPAEGCYRRNGKREESSRQKKVSDDRQHYDKWTEWKYEKEGWEEGWAENAEFTVKDLPLGRTLWLIEYSFHALDVRDFFNDVFQIRWIGESINPLDSMDTLVWTINFIFRLKWLI